MNHLLFKKSTFLAMLILLASILLGACSSAPAPDPSPTFDLVATIVAQTLAAQPTPLEMTTPVATEPPTPTIPTPSPTLEPTATAEPSPTPEPSSTSIPTASPVPATAIPAGTDPRTQLGSPTFTDNMNTSTYWSTGADDFTDAAFRNDSLYITALTGTDGWRLATMPSLVNFYAEVSGAFEACSGTDHFGLIVRVPERNPADRGYLFGVSCDGKYTFNEWDGSVEPRGLWTNHINWTTNSAILPGEKQTNRVGVMATGSLLELYVNGVKVAEIQDDTFAEGYLGIYVGSDETDQLTVRISDFSYWKR
jgi:hypothetical protein